MTIEEAKEMIAQENNKKCQECAFELQESEKKILEKYGCYLVHEGRFSGNAIEVIHTILKK